MKITDFEKQIQLGDTIIILDGHRHDANPKYGNEQFKFVGYDGKCNICPGCPGYVNLIREDGHEISDCFRSHVENSIRLRVGFSLPDELFELE